MCGIVGYIGTSEAMPVLFDLLKKLEYRGYDSAGIAILNNGNDEIRTSKTEGSVDDLISITPDLGGHIGIGHTRWATHGKPSTMNAHPHSDSTGRIAFVHNGIIENYIEIKDTLIKLGHEFKSETDTEVLPHLIEEYYDGDLESAVRSSLSMVRGSYALAVISVDNPGKIVVARKGSPLVIGLGGDDFFVASDVSGIL
ncbi:glutamine--fructose-6-phosphate aminotransferase, partial [Methanosarcinales archaeon]